MHVHPPRVWRAHSLVLVLVLVTCVACVRASSSVERVVRAVTPLAAQDAAAAGAAATDALARSFADAQWSRDELLTLTRVACDSAAAVSAAGDDDGDDASARSSSTLPSSAARVMRRRAAVLIALACPSCVPRMCAALRDDALGVADVRSTLTQRVADAWHDSARGSVDALLLAAELLEREGEREAAALARGVAWLYADPAAQEASASASAAGPAADAPPAARSVSAAGEYASVKAAWEQLESELDTRFGRETTDDTPRVPSITDGSREDAHEDAGEYESTMETMAFSDAVLLRRRFLEWRGMTRLLSTLRDEIEGAIARRVLPPVTPMTVLSYPFPPSVLHTVARVWAEWLLHRVSEWQPSLPPLARWPRRGRSRGARAASAPPRLNIGYLTSDVAAHTMAYLMQPVYEMHDRRLFNVTFYALADGQGYGRALSMANADRYVDLTQVSNADAVALMRRNHRLDVLVDLDGWSHTERMRVEIVGARAAPLQISFLGFLQTSGSAALVDLLVVDRIVVPPSSQTMYDEGLLVMPCVYQVNDHRRYLQRTYSLLPERPRRVLLDLPADASGDVVFTNFNQLYKWNNATVDAWARVLRALPRSVLWLLANPAGAVSRARALLAERGVDVARQVRFMATVGVDMHLHRVRAADIFLDTLLYNSGTTASDALAAGLPLVTMPTRRYVGRMSSSLVNAAGLAPELVVRSVDEYVARAVELATNATLLARVRRKAEAARLGAPLFDTQSWLRAFETGVRMAAEQRVFIAATRASPRSAHAGTGAGRRTHFPHIVVASRLHRCPAANAGGAPRSDGGRAARG